MLPRPARGVGKQNPKGPTHLTNIGQVFAIYGLRFFSWVDPLGGRGAPALKTGDEHHHDPLVFLHKIYCKNYRPLLVAKPDPPPFVPPPAFPYRALFVAAPDRPPRGFCGRPALFAGPTPRAPGGPPATKMPPSD